MSLLVIDADPGTMALVPRLRAHYHVAIAAGVTEARDMLARSLPDIVMTELRFVDGSALDICHRVKTVRNAPTVLLTTQEVDGVAAVLRAGGDAVLLKPFAPNLLHARVARLARMRQLVTGRFTATTNQLWPETPCPHCHHLGVTEFDFASYRRAWYACLACGSAWLHPRQE
jgi:DNA-binding response OmpR family regulator